MQDCSSRPRICSNLGQCAPTRHCSTPRCPSNGPNISMEDHWAWWSMRSLPARLSEVLGLDVGLAERGQALEWAGSWGAGVPSIPAERCGSPQAGLVSASSGRKCWGKERLGFQRAFETAAESTWPWKQTWPQLTGVCWAADISPWSSCDHLRGQDITQDTAQSPYPPPPPLTRKEELQPVGVWAPPAAKVCPRL